MVVIIIVRLSASLDLLVDDNLIIWKRFLLGELNNLLQRVVHQHIPRYCAGLASGDTVTVVLVAIGNIIIIICKQNTTNRVALLLTQLPTSGLETIGIPRRTYFSLFSMAM